MSAQIIETSNVKAIKNAVRRAIHENGMTAVIAEVGSGKTTMFNYLEEHWRSHSDKVRVVTIKSFDSPRTRIGIIMRLMLETLNPSIKIPQSNELIYKLLEEELRKYTQKNYKIMRMIDEAQDLRGKTHRDIKKIHEIAGNGMQNLFSVIMFGKPSKRWANLYDDPELGHRVDVHILNKLSDEDILRIAQEKYHIRFQSETVGKRFCAMVTNKTPLGIQFLNNAIKREIGLSLEETVFIDNQLLLKVPTLEYKIRFKKAGITQQEFASYCRKVSPGRKYNIQRISEWMNGHLSPDDQVARELTILAEEMLTNVCGTRRERIFGVA